MQSLRKLISCYMHLLTIIMVIVILAVATIINILDAQRLARASANAMFIQIAQVLLENQRDLEEIEKNYRQTCLHSAETIAYIIEENPAVLESEAELEKIAEFIEVDEIHIFDSTGRIFAGTHPEYYDLTFDSGEQIMFFKPMLEDKSLKLVQDITPNTAEEKLMQYSALWSKNGEFIVQVGMEPVNVMRVTEKNELSYIFSMLKVNVGVDLYAIDGTSWRIVGSTATSDVGKNMTEVGFHMETIKKKKSGFHATISGVNSYCVFTKVDSNWIGRVVSNDTLYKDIAGNVLGLALCCILLGGILSLIVTRNMNRYVVDGIRSVNKKLRSIAQGNLHENVDVKNCTEFAELSTYINEMVRSLLDNNRKMSYVLSKTNMYIGIYEYNEHMSKVWITEEIPRIFGLDEETMERFASDYVLFKEFMTTIRENSMTNEEGIYRLEGKKEKYVRIEESISNGEIFGVVIDVTEEITKRKRIEEERDIDPLTGLYNRRGLEIRLAKLFKHPERLGQGALIMIDADGLKEINDKYGHDDGDVYLQKIGNIISGFGTHHSIAARQGGDEYVLFLYDYADYEELLGTLDSLKEIQSNSMVRLGNGENVPLRFSFGYVSIQGRRDYLEMLKEADDKMYEDKRARKEKLKCVEE